MSDSNSNISVCYLPVVGFPGYKVGDDGSVWSCWTVGKERKRVIGTQWKQLKPTLSIKKDGLKVVLYREGKRYEFKVHQLVLSSFIGPCPIGMECCHFPDRSVLNNNMSNLRYDTKVGNMGDKIFHGTHNKGIRNGRVKLTEDNVRDIRNFYQTGEYSYDYLGNLFNVSKQVIFRVITRKSWKHIK